MKVVKVLNNSLVLALDEYQDEVVIMGKGIGFNTHIGNHLLHDKIEKIYVLKDRNTLKKLIQLSSETAAKYFDLSSQIIEYAQDKYNLRLNDRIYLSLTDHISLIKKRLTSGYVLQNAFVVDLKRLNPQEFDIAQYALSLLREQVASHIPDSEATYIAMHFIYQQDSLSHAIDYSKLNELVEDILNISKYQLQLEYDIESLVYARFLTHLSLFVQRVLFDEMLPNKESDVLYDVLATHGGRELLCLQAIEAYIMAKQGKKLTNQEKLYLLIHIHKIYDEYTNPS